MMGGRYSTVNNGKTHDQHAQLVGWRYHKGIALSPEFKGYILSNKQLAARSNNNQVQQWQRSNNSKSPMMARSNNGKIQKWQGPTMARSNNSKSPITTKSNNDKVQQRQSPTTVKSNNGSRVWSPLMPKSVNERGGSEHQSSLLGDTKSTQKTKEGPVARSRRVQKATKGGGKQGQWRWRQWGKEGLVTCWKKKCALTWVVIYFKLSLLSPTFIVTLSSSLPPPFIAFGTLFDLTTILLSSCG